MNASKPSSKPTSKRKAQPKDDTLHGRMCRIEAMLETMQEPGLPLERLVELNSALKEEIRQADGLLTQVQQSLLDDSDEFST